MDGICLHLTMHIRCSPSVSRQLYYYSYPQVTCITHSDSWNCRCWKGISRSSYLWPYNLPNTRRSIFNICSHSAELQCHFSVLALFIIIIYIYILHSIFTSTLSTNVPAQCQQIHFQSYSLWHFGALTTANQKSNKSGV